MSMDEVYREHFMTVYKYLLNLCSNEQIAEEITQETFYQAIKSIDRFNGSCKVTTWLCSIAKNQLHKYWNSHPKTEELAESLTDMSDSAESIMGSIEKVEILKRIHTLENPTREVMHLRIFGDLSFREIGEVFGKTENWARVTYYRGKTRIRKELNKDE